MNTPVQIEVSKSAIGHADGLTQWAFLLNGAAAAGLLTFLGNAIERQNTFPHWQAFSDAMVCFIAGLLLAVVSRFCTFLALNFFAQYKDRSFDSNVRHIHVYMIIGDKGTICAVAAFLFFVASCSLFCTGVLYGRHAIFG